MSNTIRINSTSTYHRITHESRQHEVALPNHPTKTKLYELKETNKRFHVFTCVWGIPYPTLDKRNAAVLIIFHKSFKLPWIAWFALLLQS